MHTALWVLREYAHGFFKNLALPPQVFIFPMQTADLCRSISNRRSTASLSTSSKRLALRARCSAPYCATIEESWR